MLEDDLAQLVEDLRHFRADTSRVEAKKASRVLPQRLWETLSAFANTPGGGVIILGLDEEAGFATVGVEDPGKIQADVASLCDQMEPPLRPLIELHRFEGRTIVTVEVPEAPFNQKPCFYKGAGLMGGAFIRVADGDRRLTQYEVQLFLDARGQPTYDLEPVPGTTLKDLDEDLLKQFLGNLRRKTGTPYHGWGDDRLLRVFRVITEHEGVLTPTLAGYLTFGVYPQEVFPGLHLTVVRYPSVRAGETGPLGERLVDNVKVEGNIITMLEEGLRAIRKNIATRAVIRGLFREDVPEYPLEFLREALVNALVHRDYSPLARGSAVQVRIFPDRIEIENPGGLFGPVTEERLGEPGLQSSRNAYLLKILEDLPQPGTGRAVCENRGTGVVTMLEALRRAGMEPPDFHDSRTTFRVVVSNASLLDEETLAWLNGLAGLPLRDTQRLALAYVRRHDRIRHAEYRRLNPQLDSGEVSKELRELIALGLLEPHGTRRWTYYTLKDYTPEQTGGRRGKVVVSDPQVQQVTRPRRPDRREEIVRVLRQHGALSAAEIAAQLGLTRQAVLNWLSVLRAEGRVETTTPTVRSPHVRYRVRD